MDEAAEMIPQGVPRPPSRRLLILLVALGAFVAALPFLLALGGAAYAVYLVSTGTEHSYVTSSSEPGVRRAMTKFHSTDIRQEWREVRQADGTWIKEGPSTRWNRQGKKIGEGRYQNDKPEGQWMCWNDDESIDPDQSGIYRNGVRIGPAWSITLERTVCDGTCPVYEVTVAGDGSVHYEGVTFVRVLGNVEAAISPEAASRILERVQDLELWDLRLDCDFKVFDAPHVILKVNHGARSVEFDNVSPGNMEDRDAKVHLAIEEVADLVDEVVGTARWIKE